MWAWIRRKVDAAPERQLVVVLVDANARAGKGDDTPQITLRDIWGMKGRKGGEECRPGRRRSGDPEWRDNEGSP